MSIELEMLGLEGEHARETREELIRASRLSLLGEMVTTISHEINQPLAAIAANCDAARRWFDRNPPNLVEVGAALDRVVRDQRRISDVIARLRGFTLMGERAYRDVHVNGAIMEILAILSDELRSSGICVRPVLGVDIPKIMADRIQIQQVIINLILNARDAMRDTPERLRRLVISTQSTDGKFVSIHVEDSGNGLPSGFDQRLSETMFTNKADGSGIGLAISQYIVEGHCGQILARPAGNVGTIFEVRLPVRA